MNFPPSPLSIFILLFVIFLGSFLIRLYRYSKIVHILNDQCDPIEFLKKSSCIDTLATKEIYHIGKSVALMSIGLFSEAMASLEMVSTKKLSRPVSMAYYNNLIAINLHAGNFDKAKEVWHAHEEQLLLAATSNKSLSAINVTHGAIELLCGDITLSKEILTKASQGPLHNMNTAFLYYFRGLLELKTGNVPDALKLFGKVTALAPKTYLPNKIQQVLLENNIETSSYPV